jgi:hypothetical protein
MLWQLVSTLKTGHHQVTIQKYERIHELKKKIGTYYGLIPTGMFDMKVIIVL